MEKHLKLICLLTCATLTSTTVFGDSVEKLAKRARNAATVLADVATMPDRTIPRDLLKNSVCIATIPNVVRAGFVFGAKVGKGIVSCRTSGGWSAPSYLNIGGGSFGLQVGVDSTDLILVFVRANAPERVSQSNLTLGGSVSLAVGPLGRDAEAGTDYQLNSEIYTYARSRGLFGGLTLEGAVLKVENDSNTMMYGTPILARNLLAMQSQSAPQQVEPYVEALMKYAP